MAAPEKCNGGRKEGRKMSTNEWISKAEDVADKVTGSRQRAEIDHKPR